MFGGRQEITTGKEGEERGEMGKRWNLRINVDVQILICLRTIGLVSGVGSS